MLEARAYGLVSVSSSKGCRGPQNRNDGLGNTDTRTGCDSALCDRQEPIETQQLAEVAELTKGICN